jgi:hypothetical protein
MRPTIRALLLLAPFVLVAGCDDEGPAERAAERVGRAVDEGAERLRDSLDPPRNALDRAGRAVERAVD